MEWNYIKDKILVWGEDDYVFADAFVSIISEFNSDNDHLIRNTFSMLRELISEELISVYILKTQKEEIIELINYHFNDPEDIEEFIKGVNKEWSQINYKLPQPNQLFWISTNEKGKQEIQQNSYSF